MRAVMDGFGRKSSSVLPCHTHPNIVFARLDWVSVKSGGSSLQDFFWGGVRGDQLVLTACSAESIESVACIVD